MAYMVGHGYRVFYTGDGGTNWNSFGVGTRVSSLGASNNVERIFILGQREAGGLVPLKFEGSWSIETFPRNLQVLEDFGFGVQKEAGINDIVIVDDANSVVRKLVSAVAQRATLSARQGEIVRLSLDGLYKKNDYTTATITTDDSDEGTPLTFADGQVTIDGITAGIVQSFEVSINMNANPVYGLGSRFFKTVVLQAFEAEGRATILTTQDEYKSFFGAKILNDDTTDLGLFDITLQLGSNTLTLTANLVNEITHSIEPNELVLLDIVFYAKKVTF